MASANYYLQSDEAQPAKARQAIQWLIGSSSSTVYLAVIQNSIVDHIFRDVLGKDFVRNLIKRGSALLDGHEVVLVTHTRMQYNPVPSRLLAFYPDEAFLDELDAIPRITAMLVVPYQAEEIETWRKARNAVPLGQPQQARVTMHLSDRVVEAAVRSLAQAVNQANRLASGRDRERAVLTFRILLEEGHLSYDPEDVKVFLMSECGFDGPLADTVKEIAEQILQGRRLRADRSYFVPNIMDIWKEDAQGSS